MCFDPIIRVDCDFMKRLFISLVLLLGIFAIRTAAQEFPETEIRKMNLLLVENIEKLEGLSSVSGALQAEEYMSMFRDRNVHVYNDLMGVSADKYIPLTEYVQALRKMSDVQVSFSNVTKSKPFVSAGSLCTLVSFDKTISYRDSRNVLYSSDDMYGAPYRVEVLFAYDDFDGTCYIESVSCVMPESARQYSSGHLVYRPEDGMEDVRFRLPEVEQRKGFYDVDETGYLKYNKVGQAFLPEGAADEDWYYMQDAPEGWDPDVFINASATKDGFLNLDRKYKRFRVKAYNSVAPVGVYKVDGDFDNSYSMSDELGVEFRYMPNLGRRLNLGVYGALGVSYSYLGLSLRELNYDYKVSETVLSYDFDLLGQRYHTVDAVLSGGLAIEYALSRRWTLDVTAGAKAYYNVYAQAGNLNCDYTLAQEGGSSSSYLGHFRADGILSAVEFTPDVWPCPLSVTAGLGLNYSLTKSTLFTFGLKYEHGLNCYYQSELKSYRDYKNPIRYSTVRNKNVAYWDFADCFNLRKEALWIDLGIMFKF